MKFRSFRAMKRFPIAITKADRLAVFMVRALRDPVTTTAPPCLFGNSEAESNESYFEGNISLHNSTRAWLG